MCAQFRRWNETLRSGRFRSNFETTKKPPSDITVDSNGDPRHLLRFCDSGESRKTTPASYYRTGGNASVETTHPARASLAAAKFAATPGASDTNVADFPSRDDAANDRTHFAAATDASDSTVERSSPGETRPSVAKTDAATADTTTCRL